MTPPSRAKELYTQHWEDYEMARLSRRAYLTSGLAALSVSLAGCTQDIQREETETETPTAEYTEAGCWPAMCAGTQLLELDVNSEFSGTTVLEASCRAEDRTVQSGESVTLVRDADGATCGVTLFIDGEQVYDERIEGHESVTLTVRSSGDVAEERVML